MATKKTADLSSTLVATKGSAVPPPTAPARSAAPADAEDAGNNVPLNFRVPAELRRRFRMFAAAHDMKLNELLRVIFDDYEKRHGH